MGISEGRFFPSFRKYRCKRGYRSRQHLKKTIDRNPKFLLLEILGKGVRVNGNGIRLRFVQISLILWDIKKEKERREKTVEKSRMPWIIIKENELEAFFRVEICVKAHVRSESWECNKRIGRKDRNVWCLTSTCYYCRTLRPDNYDSRNTTHPLLRRLRSTLTTLHADTVSLTPPLFRTPCTLTKH